MSSAAESPTREAILAAGRELLLSKRAFSMGSVAKAAGVSRQAVYLHFADRYALLEAIVDQVVSSSELGASRERIAEAKTGMAALGILLGTVAQIANDHGPIDRAVRQVLASDPKLSTRWARRRGRSAMIRLVVSRLEAEGALRAGVSGAACESLLHAFSAPDFLLPLLGSMSVAEAAELLSRAVAAAALRPGKRIPSPRDEHAAGTAPALER